MSYFKKHLPLFVALLLPVIMVVFIAGAIFLPTFFSHPVTDFMYTTGSDYYGIQYLVQYQKVYKSETTYPGYFPKQLQEPKLFIYNSRENTSKQISFEQAETYSLDENSISPDGYKVEYGSQSGGFFPFFMYSGSDYNSIYLTNNGVSYKLDIINSNTYSGQFKFLGWIIK